MYDLIRHRMIVLGILLLIAGCSSSGGSGSNGEAATASYSAEDGGTSDQEVVIQTGAWYKGDLHAHSLYSDGDTPVYDVLYIAEQKGFDYFALTDHSTHAQWYDPAFISGSMTLLYGVEWTTDKGHANIWSDLPYAWETIAPTDENCDARTAIETAHSLARNGQIILFSINHPHADFCCPWEYSFEDSQAADAMEVWNARFALPNLNFLALSDTYRTYLSYGKKLTLVGGSDVHPHQPTDLISAYNDIGHPTTWIKAASKSARDLLQGLAAGHVFVSTNPSGPRLEFMADCDYDPAEPAAVDYDIMMGDTIPADAYGKDVYFMVHVTGVTVPSWVVVIKNGLAFKTQPALSADYCYGFTDTPEPGDYYRVEVRQLFPDDSTNPFGELPLFQGFMAALTNPIYAW